MFYVKQLLFVYLLLYIFYCCMCLLFFVLFDKIYFFLKHSFMFISLCSFVFVVVVFAGCFEYLTFHFLFFILDNFGCLLNYFFIFHCFVFHFFYDFFVWFVYFFLFTIIKVLFFTWICHESNVEVYCGIKWTKDLHIGS